MDLAKKILRFSWRLIRTFILVIAIMVGLFVVAIDNMLPRQIFTIVIPGLIVMGIVLSLVFMKLRIKLPHISISIPEGRNLDDMILDYARHHLILTCTILSLFILVPLLFRTISDYHDKSLANESLDHFSVISTPTVSDKRVTLTRTELEKSLREISSYTEVSINDPIKVHLYANSLEFQKSTGSPKSVYGLTQWFSDLPPEIYIPAELPPDEKPIFNEGAPVHELTHAIEALIVKDRKSVPLWITEGLANQYQDFWERVLGHVGIWLTRDKIMSYDELSLYRYDYPKDEAEKSSFYADSYEFVRYLFMRYGESNVWEMIHEVGAGASYENAFTHITNKSEKELYRDWQYEWLQGWQFGEWHMLFHQLH